jgi:hypothetical protein
MVNGNWVLGVDITEFQSLNIKKTRNLTKELSKEGVGKSRVGTGVRSKIARVF